MVVFLQPLFVLLFLSLGYYLYIEASTPRRQGDLARISTPQYQASTGSKCLQLWYHMYGTNIGSLTIFLQDTTGKHQVWQKSGNQVNLWLYTMVTLTPSANYSVSYHNAIPFKCMCTPPCFLLRAATHVTSCLLP